MWPLAAWPAALPTFGPALAAAPMTSAPTTTAAAAGPAAAAPPVVPALAALPPATPPLEVPADPDARLAEAVVLRPPDVAGGGPLCDDFALPASAR